MGKEAHGVAGFARERIKDWCDLFKWPKQSGYYFSEYGRENCNYLANEFCHMSEYYYSLYLCSDVKPKTNFAFAKEDVDAYEVSEELRAWMCSLTIEDPAFVRGHELMQLAPKLGPVA